MQTHAGGRVLAARLPQPARHRAGRRGVGGHVRGRGHLRQGGLGL